MYTDVWAHHAVTARVVRHRRLSVAIARRFTTQLPKHLDHDDVYAAADLGLMSAAVRFDPSYGVPFGAYARLRIAGSVRDELRRVSPLPRRTRTPHGVPHDSPWPVVTLLSEGHAHQLAASGPSVEEILVAAERLRFVRVALTALPPPLARVLPCDGETLPLRVLALRDGVSVATLSRRRMQAKTWLKTAVAFYDGQAGGPCPPPLSRYLRQVTIRAGMPV